jgi:hypothetical protein
MAFDRAGGYVGSGGIDIYAELATAYVEPGLQAGVFHILNDDRVAVMRAWAETIVPGDGPWPGAGELDTVEYIDANLVRAPRLRHMALDVLDASDVRSEQKHSAGFARLSLTERVGVLDGIEQDFPNAFVLIKELVYESYYRNSSVLKVVEAQTGFHPRYPVDGFGRPNADEVMQMLSEMADRPSIVREVTK